MAYAGIAWKPGLAITVRPLDACGKAGEVRRGTSVDVDATGVDEALDVGSGEARSSAGEPKATIRPW
jgi:hypothetical protein